MYVMTITRRVVQYIRQPCHLLMVGGLLAVWLAGIDNRMSTHYTRNMSPVVRGRGLKQR